MKRLIALALTMSVASISNQASAQWVNGNQLYAWCSSEVLWEKASCSSYVAGSLDQSDLSANALQTPQGATRGQMAAVVLKYLNNHPENRDWPGGLIVFAAVREAWPYLNKSGK